MRSLPTCCSFCPITHRPRERGLVRSSVSVLFHSRAPQRRLFVYSLLILLGVSFCKICFGRDISYFMRTEAAELLGSPHGPLPLQLASRARFISRSGIRSCSEWIRIRLRPGVAETAELSGFSTVPARFSSDLNVFLHIFSIRETHFIASCGVSTFFIFCPGTVVKSARACCVVLHNG